MAFLASICVGDLRRLREPIGRVVLSTRSPLSQGLPTVPTRTFDGFSPPPGSLMKLNKRTIVCTLSVRLAFYPAFPFSLAEGRRYEFHYEIYIHISLFLCAYVPAAQKARVQWNSVRSRDPRSLAAARTTSSRLTWHMAVPNDERSSRAWLASLLAIIFFTYPPPGPACVRFSRTECAVRVCICVCCLTVQHARPFPRCV